MPFTEEQKAELAKLVSDTLKTALPDALGENLKPITDSIAAQKTALDALKGSGLTEEQVAAKVAKALEDAKKGDDKGKGKGDDDVDPKIAARLAELEGKLAEQTTAAETADKARRNEALLSRFRTEIAKHVPPDRVDDVVAVLHHSQGRVRYDDAGNMGLHTKRSGPAGDYEEIVPFEKALPEWTKGDGKRFLPASSVQGTGTGAGSPPSLNKSGELTPAGMEAAISNALRLVE